MSRTLHQSDSDHMSRVEALLHEAGSFEPSVEPPADFVNRALARRGARIKVRTRRALVFAFGLASFAAAVSLISTTGRSGNGRRNLASAGPQDLNSSHSRVATVRLSDSPAIDGKVKRNANDRIETQIEKRPRVRLAGSLTIGRRTKIPVARWEEHVVREYRSGVLAPAVLLQPDPDHQEIRIQPAVVDIPLHYEVKPVSQTDMKTASPDAGWGGQRQGE